MCGLHANILVLNSRCHHLSDEYCTKRPMDEMGAVYVPDVESVGSSRGFFLSGRTRSTTILAMYGFVVKEDITMDVGDGRRAAQRVSRKVRTE